MKTNERYLEIFNKLENKTSTKHVNSKILLVDGLNSFIRAFAVNPSMNDNGVHIGGISGFLHTVSYAIRHTNPTRVIIVFDGPGGSIKRKKLFPEYKANRRTKTRIAQHGYYDTYDAERNSMNWQIKRLVEYLNFLPVQSMSVRDIEADDAIGYLCKTEFDDYEKIIMSTDKDFLQLIDKNTKVWSPTKKRLYTVDNMTEDYEVPAHNWAVYRSLTGDVSDNIPGVKGMGLKTIKKRLPILLESNKISVNDILIYTKKLYDETNDKGKKVNNYKVYSDLLDNKDQFILNYKLVQLNDVNISSASKSMISNQINQPIQKLVKFQFLKLMLEDRLNTNIKNPDLWIREAFSNLNIYATK